jgi:hypothetical protein
LAYANPFLPSRVEFERVALGDDFVKDEPIWSAKVADPERVRPNIWRIQEKLGPRLEAARPRLGPLGISLRVALFCGESFAAGGATAGE